VGVNETTQSHAPKRRAEAPWADGHWAEGRGVLSTQTVDGFNSTDWTDPSRLGLASDNLEGLVDNSCCREGAVDPDEFSQERSLDSRTDCDGLRIDQRVQHQDNQHLVRNQLADRQVQQLSHSTIQIEQPNQVDLFRSPRWQNFDEFYVSIYPRLLRLGVALVWSKAVAEDHVQDAFAKTYARFASLEEPEAYVRKTLINDVRIAFRRKQMMQRFAPLLRSATSHSDRYTDDSLLKGLDSLPLRQRTAIILRYYGQYSEQEIAHALNCRPGTVKSLLSRGLASLRKVVDHE
jgi:RNA polymerase sigma factor (sigma-70 family)